MERPGSHVPESSGTLSGKTLQKVCGVNGRRGKVLEGGSQYGGGDWNQKKYLWGLCCSRVILGAKRHDVVTVGNVASATEELSFKFYFTLINFKCK